MPDAELALEARLLAWLGAQAEPSSLARVARQLDLAQSQLRRSLSTLGPQGLGLIAVDERDPQRTRIALDERGRALLHGSAQAAERAGLSRVQRARIAADSESGLEADWVIEEAPVALLYNGLPLVVMMLTPVQLEDFALGYSLSEGIVDQPEELHIIECLPQAGGGYAVHMQVSQARYDALASRRRGAPGDASCGLCGTEELAEVLAPLPRVRAGATPDASVVQAAMSRLHAAQALNACCGSVHAAALLLDDGELLVREDIGRHCAVDKVIGAAARSGQRGCTLLLTSRLSYEIVRKAARSQIATIACVSGPSGLALRAAHASGITVWGFVRSGRANRYG